MPSNHDLPVVLFEKPEEFAAWLDANLDASGIWVQIAKKGSSQISITLEQAQEISMCYGWVDSMVRRLDDDYYVIKFTLRKPKSNWTKGNRERAEALIVAGRMQPTGLQAVEHSKANGTWF